VPALGGNSGDHRGSDRRGGSSGTPAATPAAPRTRNPPVTTVEKNRGIFGLPGKLSTLSGTKLSAGARSSTRDRRPGAQYAGPDQARHTPRITTPSRHRATSTTATDPRPAACPANLQARYDLETEKDRLGAALDDIRPLSAAS
jgi:hypothetical protein